LSVRAMVVKTRRCWLSMVIFIAKRRGGAGGM
jgi:hypothetical protein